MFDLRQTKNAVSCVTTAFNNFMKWCHQNHNHRTREKNKTFKNNITGTNIMY